MQPQLCSRCKKNVAVVFITRMENGKNINEGLCLKCAKNLGLPQVNEMMQRMGITDEDLDNISNEMMSAFGGAENLEGIDAPDGDDEEDGKTATFPFLGRLFGGQNGDAPAPADGAADGPGHVVAALLGPGLLDPGTLAGLPAGAAEDGLIADQGLTATPRVGFDAGRAEDVGAGNPCARKLCHGSAPPPLTE